MGPWIAQFKSMTIYICLVATLQLSIEVFQIWFKQQPHEQQTLIFPHSIILKQPGSQKYWILITPLFIDTYYLCHHDVSEVDSQKTEVHNSDFM